jgi:hypothetical protein
MSKDLTAFQKLLGLRKKTTKTHEKPHKTTKTADF